MLPHLFESGIQFIFGQGGMQNLADPLTPNLTGKYLHVYRTPQGMTGTVEMLLAGVPLMILRLMAR